MEQLSIKGEADCVKATLPKQMRDGLNGRDSAAGYNEGLPGRERVVKTDKSEAGQELPHHVGPELPGVDREQASEAQDTAGGLESAHTRRVRQPGDPLWPWFGDNGLRAGWSLVLFAIVVYLLATVFTALLTDIVEQGMQLKVAGASALSTILGESGWVLAVVAAMGIAALVEKRRVGSYYLADRRGIAHFAGGLVTGFAALSVLVGGLALGGWLHLGQAGLSGTHILKCACLWGMGFLLVGTFEEGSFRCYLQYTLTRGVNFWWATGIIAAMCGFLLATSHGNGSLGIYSMALMGVGPAWSAERRKLEAASFWQAAWAGSTGFGFIHTFNRGETWVGIFAAAAIGFVFCLSIWVTGSAWWALGCHASWDWAETFFYGTPDSGFVAKGHLFTSVAQGPALWSGGTDGPEGSVLVLPVILLLAVVLLTVYGRRLGTSGPSVAESTGTLRRSLLKMR